MSAEVAHIWRHPIKSHDREALEHVTLVAGQTMPWDRVWAVAHSESDADGSAWAKCSNFSRGAKAPLLQAIEAKFDEVTKRIVLTHPQRPDLDFDPETEVDAFLNWVAPLMPENRAASARIISVPSRGMTDSDYPSVSLNNLASNQAVGDQIGQAISPLRWRGNIWFDGLEPWIEFDWVGKTIAIGGARLLVRERIKRCMMTTANPETGIRDAQTLDALRDGWGHTDFGVVAEVVETGQVQIGDKPRVL